jgi:hypothetical protein
MPQNAAPATPLVGERGLNIGQDGPLTILHALSLGHTDDDEDNTVLTLIIDAGQDPADTVQAHVDVEVDGPMVQISLALDLSALDVLDGAVRDAYAVHRRHHDERQVTA